MVVDACSIARWRYLRDKAVVGAEDLDGLEYGEPQDFEAAFLELRHFRIGTSINDDVGHDVVSLEIIEWDNHPTGRSGGGGGD